MMDEFYNSHYFAWSVSTFTCHPVCLYLCLPRPSSWFAGVGWRRFLWGVGREGFLVCRE